MISLLTRLLVALLLVGSLGFVAVRTTKLNANLLSIFNPEQAEIRGRIIHQDHFLAQQDLLIGLETEDASATEQAVTSLAAHLRSQFPDLEEPSIKERPPWESNLAGSGELAAYLWAMSSASDLRRLSQRLSPGNVDAALKDAETTLAEALTPSARTQMVALDPLTLLQVPSLTTLADTRPPPELGEATLPGHLSLSSPDGLFRVIQMDLPEQRDFPAAVRVRVQEVTSAIEVWKTESSFAGTVTICGWATYTTEVQKQIRSEFLLSILTTAVGVFILIFGAYRRILPLFFLLITLALTLFITLILASGLLGELNRMSFAFAPILIALVVDYGVIVLQGISQGAKPKETRFPVIWAASTTALVFIGLNLSSVPGVAQFGTLVAMGIALGACLSLTVYRSFVTSIKPPPPLREWKLLAIQLPHAILLTLFLVCGLLTYLWFAHLPTFDLDPNNLGGRKTESARILEEVQAKLTPDETPEPDTILFLGASSSEVQSVLEAFSEDLSDTLPDAQFLSPLPFWPEGSSRLENQVYLREKILPTQERVLGSVGEVFEHETIDFLQHAYAYWERFSREEDLELVQPLAQWATSQLIFQDEDLGHAAQGAIFFPEATLTERITLREDLKRLAQAHPQVVPMAQECLRPYFEEVRTRELRFLILPLSAGMILLLFLVFRSVRDVILSLFTLFTSALIVCTIMRLLQISWTLVNFISIPLLLGICLDFSIHIQFALRKEKGNVARVRQTIGKALLVCGTSSAIGFASLFWSTNPSLRSLGQICALGILGSLFTAVVLLPEWWRRWVNRA